MKQWKKRAFAMALALVMALGTVALAAGAEKTITVTPMTLNINGQTVTPGKSDGAPAEVFSYDGATYVPLRYLSELLGIEVDWDKDAPDTARLVNVPGFEAGSKARATVYGVYSMEGDAVDSAIRAIVTYDLEQNKVVDIDFDEALLPCAQGGAEGWAAVDGKAAPAFIVGGVTWTGAEKDGTTVYTAAIDGEEREFISYVGTQAGGEWYYANKDQGAQLLDEAGKVVSTVSIETKASIEHGVHFWVSPITFPGNIERIKEFIYENGVNYDYAPNDSIAKNADGVWTVCDTVTGATLAGTPNYLNLVKLACEQIGLGNYTAVQ